MWIIMTVMILIAYILLLILLAFIILLILVYSAIHLIVFLFIIALFFIPLFPLFLLLLSEPVANIMTLLQLIRKLFLQIHNLIT